MGANATLVPRSPAELYTRIDTYWFRLLLIGSTALVGLTTILLFWDSPFYVNKDSALFQHAGWSILNGADLYVDIWDLKPPLIYAVTVVLAALSFGDMAVLHVLSVGVAAATVVAGVMLVGVLTHRLTDDGFASLVAGTAMFALTSLYGFPYAGLRPKYFAFLCGVAGLLLAVDDRPFLGGGLAAMAAGFWQLGAPIAFLVVAISFQHDRWAGLWRAIGGGAVVTLLTVAPFVLAGHAVPLFVEVVLAPIYGVENYTVVGRLLAFGIQIGYGVFLVPLAVFGWGKALIDDHTEYWWVAAGGSVYLGQLFVEFQGAIELVFLFVFLALGIGLLVSYSSRPDRRSIIAGCVVVLVVTSGYWNFAWMFSNAPEPPMRNAVEDEYDRWEVSTYDSLPDEPEDWPSMETIYWEKLQPEYCHYRLGLKQQYFEHVTGGSLYKSTCGQWPFDEPPVQWLFGGSASAYPSVDSSDWVFYPFSSTRIIK